MDLKEIAKCGQPWAEEKAKIALELQEQYNAKTISKDEYVELIEDMARMESLDEVSSDMKLKTALVTALFVLVQVV